VDARGGKVVRRGEEGGCCTLLLVAALGSLHGG
jgi:hypothetical protein